LFGSYLPIAADYDDGQVVVYYCNGALKLVGDVENICSGGNWPLNRRKNNLPFCCKLTCLTQRKLSVRTR